MGTTMPQANDQHSLSELAEAAFRQAAVKVVERAKQFGTPLIVWEHGQIKRIPPDQFELPTGGTKPQDPAI